MSSRKWEVIKYNSKINFNSITHFGDSTLMVSGGMLDIVSGNYKNIFLRSVNGGQTWQETEISEMKTIFDAWFFSSDTGILVGKNGIVSKVYQPFTKRGQQITGSASNLQSVYFQNEVGLIVGDGGTVLRTINRGGFGLSTLNVSTKNYSIFPNPSNGIFTIACDFKIIEIHIFDRLGKEIDFTFNSDLNSLEIEQNGLYLIKVVGENSKRITETIWKN
ncbi:MAG: T9SS type A sorting domain-containing protein [Bacteroidia bacterium]